MMISRREFGKLALAGVIGALLPLDLALPETILDATAYAGDEAFRFICMADNSGSLWLSTDGGETWEEVHAPV